MGEFTETDSKLNKIKMLFKKDRFKVELYDERIKRIIQILGWVMFFVCEFWGILMFAMQLYSYVLHTTFFTTILISFTCILKLESIFLNTISSISFYGFLNVTIALIPVTDSIAFFFVGPVYHGLIAGFQIFLVFHPKIPMSKRYLLWGVLFYLAFMASYDDYQRINIITGLEQLITTDFTKAYAFYALIITSAGIYFYKKRFGILVN
ncbi:MAG: hypothetical protein ACFE78_01075 [Candidatus Hodarchaeota archaeon]